MAILYTNRKPLQSTNKPSIAKPEEPVNKNRVYLKSYIKTEENRGFQLVKYAKGHRCRRLAGGAGKKERSKERKQNIDCLIRIAGSSGSSRHRHIGKVAVGLAERSGAE